MATTTSGAIVPAVLDPFDPQGDMVDLAGSINHVIRVPNAGVATSVATTLAASPSAPVLLWQADAPAGARLRMYTGPGTFEVLVSDTSQVAITPDFTNDGYGYGVPAGTSALPGLAVNVVAAPAGSLVRTVVSLPSVDIGAAAGVVLLLKRSVAGAAATVVDGAVYSLGGGAYGSIPVKLDDTYRVPLGSAAQDLTYSVTATLAGGTVTVRAQNGAPVTMRTQVSR